MIANLPYDIQWNIAQYIDDIDVRRYFNIYRKINLDNFSFLNTIIRVNIPNINSWTRYNFACNYVHPNLKRRDIYEYWGDVFMPVDDDLMDTRVTVFKNHVEYEIYIYKLKKKPFPAYKNYKDIFFKGPLAADYFWEHINFDYKLY
tara:strand:+ start:120 stop:557 length:438 start_codon:yes stop_codon:yes gene_type:complete